MRGEKRWRGGRRGREKRKGEMGRRWKGGRGRTAVGLPFQEEAVELFHY